VINLQNSTIYFPEVDEALKNSISNLVVFPTYDLQGGIQYLRFRLKENKYDIIENGFYLG